MPNDAVICKTKMVNQGFQLSLGKSRGGNRAVTPQKRWLECIGAID